MKIQQCPNGHYYDAERYASGCPYCQTQNPVSGMQTFFEETNPTPSGQKPILRVDVAPPMDRQQTPESNTSNDVPVSEATLKNVKKCRNNHLYDGERFAECPYCKNNIVLENMNKEEHPDPNPDSLHSAATSAIRQPAPNEDAGVTMPLYQNTAPISSAAMPTADPEADAGVTMPLMQSSVQNEDAGVTMPLYQNADPVSSVPMPTADPEADAGVTMPLMQSPVQNEDAGVTMPLYQNADPVSSVPMPTTMPEADAGVTMPLMQSPIPKPDVAVPNHGVAPASLAFPQNGGESQMSYREFYKKFASKNTKTWFLTASIWAAVNAVILLALVAAEELDPFSIVDAGLFAVISALLFWQKKTVSAAIYLSVVLLEIILIISIGNTPTWGAYVSLVAGIMAVVSGKKMVKAYKAYQSTGEFPEKNI